MNAWKISKNSRDKFQVYLKVDPAWCNVMYDKIKKDDAIYP